ncbi:MAG: NAD(P)H-dependent oxidoreductase [Telmatospirillum sp.]|nr:NAD(P)H-dependent oxidoreductase [Telmatospirillum sp.]
MHAVIVVSHPDSSSLTHALAAAAAEGVTSGEPGHSVSLFDLAGEGFDPRFGIADVAAHRRTAPPPADVLDWQARLDHADALVLVYPVFWWSMPALLKGWIDRVFSNGWAYDDGANGKVGKKLTRLPVHLIAVGGADMQTYDRHGYLEAMRIQIDHGIFGYCGAPVVTNDILTLCDPGFPQSLLDRARAIGLTVFSGAAR